MTEGYIVMDSRTQMPGSVKSLYRRVAVCHVEDINNPPKMISVRAKGMLRIMVLWEKLHVGRSERGAYQVALAEANGLAATLNAGGTLEAWRAARRMEELA